MVSGSVPPPKSLYIRVQGWIKVDGGPWVKNMVVVVVETALGYVHMKYFGRGMDAESVSN